MRVPEPAPAPAWGHWWTAAVLAGGAGWLVAGAPPSLAGVYLGFARDAWPPGPHLGANFLTAAAAWLLAGGLLLVHDAAGLRLFRLLRLGRPAAALRPASPLLAYAAFSTGLLGLACVGVWWPGVVLAALAALVVFAAPALPGAMRDWRRAVVPGWRGAPPAARAAGALFSAWVVLFLSPPELDTDCLTYHLVFPQMLLRGHAMFGTWVHSHWAIPLVHELPNAIPLLFGLDAAARIMAVAMLAAGALAFLRATEPGVPAAPWTCAGVILLALALPGPRFVLGTAKNDCPAFGYWLAGAAALLESGAFRARAPSPGPWLVGALLMGCAAAMKYLELPLVLAVAAVAWVSVPHRCRVRALPFLAMGLLLPVLPWAAKSWIYLNDPLYPFGWLAMPSLFGDSGYNARNAGLFEIFLQDLRRKSDAPWEMAKLAARDAFPVLALVPFLFFRRPGRAGFGVPVAFWGASLVGYAGIVAGIRGSLDHVERFAYPVFVLWNLAVGAAIVRAGLRPVVSVAACGLAVVLGARLVAPEWWPGGTWQAHKRPSAWLVGRLSTDEFRRAGLFAYGAVLPEIRRLAASGTGRILSVGEIHLWDVPARTLVTVFEPPFVWRAVASAGGSPERVAVRFRQAGVRWIVYNSRLADWSRFTYSPYEWDAPMLRTYAGFARRHMFLLASSGRCDPGTYGSVWLYEVARRPSPPARRILFLPGAERAYSFASLAAVHGAWRDAALRFESLRRDLPGVACLDGMLGNVLLRGGRPRDAWPLLRAAAEAGFLDETSLLDQAEAAGMLGYRGEAREAVARAASAYPLVPERVRQAAATAGVSASDAAPARRDGIR